MISQELKRIASQISKKSAFKTNDRAVSMMAQILRNLSSEGVLSLRQRDVKEFLLLADKGASFKKVGDIWMDSTGNTFADPTKEYLSNVAWASQAVVDYVLDKVSEKNAFVDDYKKIHLRFFKKNSF